MNKAIKSLSAVLALSIGLAFAGLVSAEDLPLMGLNDTEIGLLEAKAESGDAGYVFYQPKLQGGEYAELLKKADSELEMLRTDAKEWGRLSVLVCEAQKTIKAIDKELALVDRLAGIALKAREVTENDKYVEFKYDEATQKWNVNPDQQVKNPGTLMATNEVNMLEKLLDENNKLYVQYNHNKNQSGPEFGKISGDLQDGFYKDAIKNNAAIRHLEQIIEVKSYQKIVAYAKQHYNNKDANNTKINKLEVEKKNAEGIVAFVQKIMTKYPEMKLSGCVLEGKKVDEKTPETQKPAGEKDNVPSTAAHR